MPANLGARVRWWWCPIQQPVVASLVVSLTMVVLDVLVNYEAQVAFTEHDDSVEALLLDRAHEPFRVGVQIRTSRRQSDRLDTTALQDLVKRAGVEGISIVNEVPRFSEETVDPAGCQ